VHCLLDANQPLARHPIQRHLHQRLNPSDVGGAFALNNILHGLLLLFRGVILFASIRYDIFTNVLNLTDIWFVRVRPVNQ